MFRKLAIVLAGGFAPLIAAFPVLAQSAEIEGEPDRLAAGVVVGTRGATLDVQYAASDRVVLRGSADVLSWQVEGDYKRTDYVVETSARTVGAFIDVHPWRSGFLVSGGVYLGEPEIDLEARPTRNLRIGGATFTPTQIGELKGGIRVNGAAPFVGVGYDNTFYRRAGWGWRAVAGATFTGTPHVALTSRGGTLSNSQAFRNRVAIEVKDIEADLADYTVFPVVQLGLNYRF